MSESTTVPLFECIQPRGEHQPVTRHSTLVCKISKIEVAVHHWSQTLTS
ncbi:MAG: hypothetical protein QNL85_03345 [Euryarchaeota archaeon]